MHDKLLAALAAFRQFLTDNPQIARKDGLKSKRLHDLDGQIRYFSDRLKLHFPDLPPFAEGQFGFCKVPCGVSYADVSHHVIGGVNSTAYCEPADNFFLTFDWQRSFETFVSMVEADKSNSPPANVEPQAAATAPPAVANATEATDDGRKPLPPSRAKAYALFEWALQQNYELAGKTDREVYEWLKTKPDQACDLPANADTFSNYLKEARRHHGTQKHVPRSGRLKGKSVVDQDQI